MKAKALLGRALPFLLAIALFYLLCKLLDTSCLFLHLFGIPCPTCGMTSALLCALRLDIMGYIQCNAMAIPTAMAVLLALHLQYFRCKRLITGIVITVLATNLIYYIVRLFG